MTHKRRTDPEPIFIEPTDKIDHYLLHASVAEKMLGPFGHAGQLFVREPCLRIRRFVAHDDRLNSIFEIELWQQLKVYATLGKK